MTAPHGGGGAHGDGGRAGESAGRRVARNSGWLLAAQLATAAFGLAQAVLLTRALGLERYGVYVLVTAIVLSLVQLLDSRLFETLTRYVPHFRARNQPERAEATLQLCIGIEVAAGLVALVSVWVAAGFAAQVFVKDPAASGLLRLYALIALIWIPQEPLAAVLRISDRFEWLAVYQASSAALTTAALAVAAWMAGTIEAVLLAQLASGALVSLGGLMLAARAWRSLGLPLHVPSPARWLRALSLLGEDRRAVLHFALHSNFNATSRLITTRADLLVLGLFGTPAAVAAYELAKRIVQQLQALSTPLYTALFPEMARLVAEGDHDAVRRLRLQLSGAVLAAVLPACAAAALLAPWLVAPVFGSEFERSVPLLQILVWQLLWLPLVWFPGFLLSLGRARELAWTSALDAAFFGALLLLAVPIWGAAGAAVAAVVRTLAWIALAAIVIRRVDRVGWAVQPG